MSNNDGNPRAEQRPGWIVNSAVLVALAVSIFLTAVAARLPGPTIALHAEGERVLAGERVVSAIRTSPGAEPFRLGPFDLIEEPDVATSWQELNEFYARQGELWRHLQAPTVELDVDGQWLEARVAERGLGSLPLTFYTLIAASFVVWVVGFVTFAFSNRGIAARIYAISAVAFCFAVWPAAIYQTRPLALQPDVFRVLSSIDHLGGNLYAAGCIMLLAVYPVRLFRPIHWLWMAGVVATVAGHYQLADISIAGYYTHNAVQFVLFFGSALWQWRASRANPVYRAALGWIVLSTFVGVIFFVTLITIPVLLGQGPSISQTTGFLCIVLMYVGISLGVLRFRLFDLDRWWFRTWSWILSGAVVIGADLLLTRLFGIQHDVALIGSLVVVGWVYFPIRQRLFERFGTLGSESRELDTAQLIRAASVQELRARFRGALETCFTPLQIMESDKPVAAPRLDGEGAWLEVPSPADDGSFRCHFRQHGARLFSREDVSRARDLVTLSRSVRAAIDARQEGETAERTRIRRDLHDDLGASIIRIAHEAGDQRTASLAKAAMRDLRDVLTSLSDTPSQYQDVLDDLEADLRARAHASGRPFEWVVRGKTERLLGARSRANLTRALRESMTNALKHGTGAIRYEFAVSDVGLSAVVQNSASDEQPIEIGMGIGNIRSRLEELGGEARFSRHSGTFQLSMELPWSSDP